MADQDRERWTKRVADFESCDLSQREFANERGVPLSNLRNWLYKLRKETRPLATEAAEVPPMRETGGVPRLQCRY